jgi:hypothetical protein
MKPTSLMTGAMVGAMTDNPLAGFMAAAAADQWSTMPSSPFRTAPSMPYGDSVSAMGFNMTSGSYALISGAMGLPRCPIRLGGSLPAGISFTESPHGPAPVTKPLIGEAPKRKEYKSKWRRILAILFE